VTTAIQTDPERDGVAAVGALLDRRVRPRAAFEAWISAPPYEREIERFGEGSAWPGNYRDIDVDLAWNAWIDAVTMTRERCASIAENYDLGTPEGHAIAGCIRGA